MRQQEEILDRIKERQEDDWLGFEISEYIRALTYENASPWIKEDVKPEEWTLTDHDTILEDARLYMPFAVEKAEGERGISANRSIMHYIAWLWLLGENDLLQKVEHEYNTNYHSYGLPILRMIREHFGWHEVRRG